MKKILVINPNTSEEMTADVRATVNRIKGADVLVLGCAGMTTLKDIVEERTGMVILDPVETGYAMLEAMVCRGLKVSHSVLYAKLPQKIYIHS